MSSPLATLEFNVGALQQEVMQAVNRIEIGRVADGDGDGVVDLGNGDGAVFFGDVPADERDDVIRQAQFGEVDDFGAEVGGLGLGDVGGADDLVRQQVRSSDPHARTAGLCPGRVHLGGRYKTGVRQNIYQTIVFFSHTDLSTSQLSQIYQGVTQ